MIKKLGLKPRYPKRFKVTTDSDHNDAISPNLVNRKFDVAMPNKVWTTDITYVWTLEGWLYVAIGIDLFSRQVVGWSSDDQMRTSLCVNALQMAQGGENLSLAYSIILIEAATMQATNTEDTWG